ncbi:hypothetical protein ACB098_10G014100 [Castanea mollissima]
MSQTREPAREQPPTTLRCQKYLHYEIVHNILARLPVKSLLRFRCVCKSWDSLITSPYFISTHLYFSNVDRGDYIVNMPWYEENSYSPPSNRPVITFYRDHDGFDKIFEFEIPSSIRKLKRLPDIEFDCFMNPLGFAYDSEKNDYKVVNISYSRRKLKVEVYTSKSDSWRTLEGLDVSLGPKIDFGFNFSLPIPFFGGALHWLVDIIQGEEKHKTEMILSFDINNESFEELAVPDHCFDIGAGHEALIRFATVGEQSFACVWAIKDPYTAADLLDLNINLNATFLDLKEQLINNSKSKHFATSQQARGSDPVYAMFQCRKYLSMDDCIACFNAATFDIRRYCNASNGARVTYDGCFLRYESNAFYDQSTMPGHFGFCGIRTAPQSNAFVETVNRVLAELQVAVPRIDGFFAAIKKKVGGGGGGGSDSGNNMTVYGVAQCVESASKGACQECLKVAYGNIESCVPETDGRAVDAGCFLRYSDTPFFADNQTTNITPFLRNGDSNKKKFIIGGGVGGVCLLLIIVFFVYWYKLSRKRKEVIRDGILGASELRGPVNYKYNVLKSATKNFSEENKLGEGGFGEVYKGILKNGRVVAVKKLVIGQSRRAKADFESEVKLISNVHHRNLIRLLGCCSKGPKLLLVYEYMANSSLDKYLFGERTSILNWKQRNDIIVGTASGLAYLHEQFHVCIIHRDIKTSNILLDNDMQPKIADFGLARLLPEDQSHLSTNFAGTL